MKKRYFIYFAIIAILLGVIAYANFYMEPVYEFDESGIFEIENSQLVADEEETKVIKSKYIPQDIPESVVETANEYDYMTFLFSRPNHKVVVYSNLKEKGSKDKDSFFDEVTRQINHVVIDGRYQISANRPSERKFYLEHRGKDFPELTYTPSEDDSKKYQKEMLKNKARLEELLAFYNDCAKTMCIIDIEKMQYIYLEERNIKDAVQTLEDYRHW